MKKIETQLKIKIKDIMNYKAVIYFLRTWNFFQIASCNEYLFGGLVHRRSQGARAPPIEMVLTIKMSQKDYCFFSFSFF